MRIQHNISSLNAYRNYTNNTNSVAKNLEKLSSGYRINRAGDDAAGLAISEKMRAQITGLETAQKNAADGVSLVQTAEGALTEVHSMLNRMVELADQSANGTYDNAVDRANLQKEIKDLKDEINRIADGTNFNGINLLNGNLSSSKLAGTQVGAVLDTFAEATVAQKGKMEIDLSHLNFAKSNDAGAAGTKTKVALTIGGQKLEVELDNDKDYTAEKIVDEFVKLNVGGAANGEVKLGNVVYTMKKEGTSKISLEMKADPTGAAKDEDLVTGFGVALSVTPAAGNANNPEKSGTLTGQVNPATTTITHAVKPTTGTLAEATFTFTKDMIQDGAAIKIGKETYIFKTKKDDSEADPAKGTVIDLTDETKFDPNSASYLDDAARELTKVAGTNTLFTVGYETATNAITIQQKAGITDDADKALLKDADSIESMIQTYKTLKTEGLTLQIGDTSADYNQLNVSIEDIHTDSLGIDKIDISTQKGAKEAVDKIKNAINYISDVRGTLGATQNRLEHTMNNLSVTTENMTAAESRIRDVDVAKEMMSYTKNNILVQSAQAMLAQANQTPQGVLQLLQ